MIDPGEFHERSAAELGLAFGVLGAAFLFEGASLVVAGRVIRRGARRRGWSMRRYLRRSPDMTTKTVFWEDSAATLGLVIAALSASETADGVASIIIGVLLTVVALMVGAQARGLLLGAAATPELRSVVRATVLEFEEVDTVVRLLTMQLGARSVLVNGELQLLRDLDVEEAEHLIREIDGALRRRAPEVTSTFWELRRQALDTSVGPRIFE